MTGLESRQRGIATPRLLVASLAGLFAGVCLLASTGFCQELQETGDPYFKPGQAGRPAAEGNQLPERAAVNSSQFRPLVPAADSAPVDKKRSSAFSPAAPAADQKLQQATFTQPEKATTSARAAAMASQARLPEELPGQRFEPGRVLARVGGHPIFVSDLSVEARQIIEQFIKDAPESVKQTEMQKILPRLLPKYIQGKVLYVDVVNDLPEGANIEDILDSASDQFDENVLPMLLEQSGVKSAALLDAHYRSMGSSLRRTRQNWAENEIVKYLIRSKINTDPEVSHRELYEAYQAARDDEWALPAKVRWERLLVRFDRFPSKQAAWDALAKMGNEVVFGAPLAAVARRSSQGALADEGGMQGWTTRGSLANKELEELLFSIEPNELSDVLESPRGFQIVRVLERNEAGFVPFEEAQPEIRKRLVDKKRDKEFQNYIDAARDRVPVEVFEPEFEDESLQ